MTDIIEGQSFWPRVTVGVCVKNCQALVGDAIETIAKQDFSHTLIQVILVDDGSEDCTLSLIKSYAAKLDMDAEVLHQEWKGLGAARNVVVNNAEGKYIIWVDGDMLLSRNFVRKQVEFMEKNPKVGIAKGSYGMYTTNLVGTLENADFISTNSRQMRALDSTPLGAGGAIYRVAAIRKVGCFDERIRGSGEDEDAERRLKNAGWMLDITSATFYERRRESWKSLWDEYYWHGKGRSYVTKRHKFPANPYKLLPPVALIIESMRVVVAYKLTGKKVVLLLPIHFAFKRIAWIIGFFGNMLNH